MAEYPNDQGQPGGALPQYLTAQKSALCFSGAPRVLKASAGTVATVSVIVAGSGAGGVYDCATTGAASATANQIAAIPNFVGTSVMQFPCLVGVTIYPGTGQTISVSYT